MDRTVIFAALQWECRAVLRPLRQVRREQRGAFVCWQAVTPRGEVWLMRTGMGPERAAGAAAAAGEAGSFAQVVSTGCAGGLVRELQPGDLVLATQVVDAERVQPTDVAARAYARTLADAAGLRSMGGPILCSPTALASLADKRRAAASGAVAVEMEGGPLAAWAARGPAPFLSVRAVLDGADDALNVAGNFIDPLSGGVRPLALAGYVAAHPGAVGELLAMQRMQRAARDSLERFFAHWLAAPPRAP